MARTWMKSKRNDSVSWRKAQKLGKESNLIPRTYITVYQNNKSSNQYMHMLRTDAIKEER